MPITLTLSDGLLSPDAEARVFAELTDTLLDIEQLDGNAFMEPNVIGTVNVVPGERIYAGGKPGAAAFVELKLPGVALATPDAKRRFIERATEVVERAAAGKAHAQADLGQRRLCRRWRLGHWRTQLRQHGTGRRDPHGSQPIKRPPPRSQRRQYA